MNCEKTTIPTRVKGNEIPCTVPLEIINIAEEGAEEQPFVPEEDDVIVCNLVGARVYSYTPDVADNVLTFTVAPNVLCGTYGLEVLITRAEGSSPRKYRSFRRNVLRIVESNDEANVATGVELEAGGAVLDSAVLTMSVASGGGKEEVFVVNVKEELHLLLLEDTVPTYTPDKTFEQMVAAVEQGKLVVLKCNGFRYYLSSAPAVLRQADMADGMLPLGKTGSNAMTPMAQGGKIGSGDSLTRKSTYKYIFTTPIDEDGYVEEFDWVKTEQYRGLTLLSTSVELAYKVFNAKALKVEYITAESNSVIINTEPNTILYVDNGAVTGDMDFIINSPSLADGEEFRCVLTTPTAESTISLPTLPIGGDLDDPEPAAGRTFEFSITNTGILFAYFDLVQQPILELLG